MTETSTTFRHKTLKSLVDMMDGADLTAKFSKGDQITQQVAIAWTCKTLLDKLGFTEQDIMFARTRLPYVDTTALTAADRINKHFGLSLNRLELGAIIREHHN